MGTVIIDVPAGPANPRSRDPRNAPHHYEITQIICSPNMEYIATLSREDMKIVIWPVDEEKRLNPSNIIEFRELDEWANFPPFDALSFYFEFLSLHEISDEKFLIVDSRPDTAYEMFDVTNKQHVDVPNKEHKRGWHFLKDGHFVTYNEYELNLYTIVTEYAQIYFLLERVIVNSQPTLMRIITPTGKLIQVDNSHYLSLWDIKTAVLEQQFDDQNYRHLIKASINEEGTLIAFNRKKDELKGELAVYSIKTGIVLSTGPSGGEMMDVYFGVNHQDWLIIPSYDTKRKDENPYNYVPITGFSIMTPHALDKSMEFSLDSIVDSHRVNPRLIKEDRLICVVDGFLQVEDIFAKVNGNLSFNTHFMLREIEYIISQIKYVPSYLNEVYPGKRVTWTVFTSDEIEHAPPIVSAFKLDETTYSWNPLGSPLILEIDGYDLLTHMHISSYLLINDDLIICTTTLIMILTVEPEGKIRMIYSWGSHDDLIGFTDRIEYFESIMERENLVMKYQDGEMIRPFKMMIKDFLTDVSTFSSYSHAILRASLKLSRDEIVKHIVDKSLQRFEENRRDVNILSIVARSFTEIFKFQPNYISKIVDAIHKSKTGRESFEPVLRGYTYDNHLRSPSFSSRVSLWVYDTVLILNPYRWALLIYHLFSKETHVIKPSTEFIIPLPKFASYPGESVSYKEIMWKPESNQFTKFWDSKFYEDWNGEVLVDFKWRTFGKDYYFFIWTVYTIFLLTFTLVATEPSNIDFSEFLLWVSILLGSFQLSIEVRQFFHDWKKYLVSFWNLFDLCVYIFPIATAISLLKDGSAPVWALAISNFLLDIKFLLFFRVFKSFSGYFEIFFGVAKSLVSFFVVLTLIFLAYYHALYVIIEEDSENSATWNNPMIIIFFGLVGIFTITYLSSLLIRLLNEEVHHAKERESFLAYKIMILAKIELFYLLPQQRRWRHWFPDYIYYTADAE